MFEPRYVGVVLVVALGVTMGVMGRVRGDVAPQGKEARQSSMLLGIMHSIIVVAVIAGPVLKAAPLLWPAVIPWVAVGVMVASFGLQIWAMHTLGRWFTLSLVTDEMQPLIERGPYRFIRHPAYLAQALFFLAFGVSAGDGLALSVVALAVVVGYGRRIHVEEQLLAWRFSDRWHDYARRTRRVVPFLY